MQQQLTIFPEPEIEPTFYCSPKGDVRKKLEDIAIESCEHPLLFGEWKNVTSEGRLDKMMKYLDGNAGSAYLQLIKFEDEIIGGAYIWDGWIAIEMEYVFPEVELGFIHPNYHQYNELIQRKLRGRLPEIYEGRRNDW